MADVTSPKRQRLDEDKEANVLSTCLVDVRRSTAALMKRAKHVVINEEKLRAEIEQHPDLYQIPPNLDWAPEGGYHYRNKDDSVLTAQYVLVLDALNFCFWPVSSYEYAELAGSLKQTLENNPDAFSANNLLAVTPEDVKRWLQPKDKQFEHIPLVEVRARLLQEVGRGLLRNFGGLAANLIRAAKGSAATLVDLVTSSFPGFRDHAVCGGDQVFFYKRAQIFVADVYLCFQGQGLGAFSDIAQLTCFADYRLPQLMFHLGILSYDEQLKDCVLRKEELTAGSAQELEIRAATVQAVELMRAEAQRVTKQPLLLSLQLDNLLWERGEAMLAELPPHHRTLTVYY